MKESVKEFPWNIFNLSQGVATAQGASQVKVNKGLVYLFLIVCLACFHNQCTAAGNDLKLFTVKNRPVNVAPLHNPAKNHGDSGVITVNSGSHSDGDGFFGLLFKELESASPDKVSPSQVTKGNNKNSVLAELKANIDKLCHILLAYFIPAVMFFISVPAIIFYWAHGSLKSERRMMQALKYNIQEEKKQGRSVAFDRNKKRECRSGDQRSQQQ